MQARADALREIVESHKALRRFLSAVEGGDDASLVGHLAWLRAHLPRHFATEEQPGGFFDAVERRHGASVVEALRRDHRLLERQLARLGGVDPHEPVDRGASAPPAEAGGEDLAEAVRAFGRVLAAHEAREAGLGVDLDDLAQPRGHAAGTRR